MSEAQTDSPCERRCAMAMSPLQERLLEEKMAEHKRWGRIMLIASIILGIMAFGRSYDVIESSWTWFLIILAITMDIMAFVMYSKYAVEVEGYAWQQKSLLIAKAEKAEDEAQEAIKNMNYYKKQTEGVMLKNAELIKKLVDITEKFEEAEKELDNRQTEQINKENSELKSQIRSKEYVVDMYRRENSSLESENKKLKKENAAVQKELNKLKRVQSEEAGKKEVKSAVGTMELEYNIDNILDTIEHEPVIKGDRINRVPNTASLKRKYALSESTINGDYTVVDLETTGLSPQKNDIIEISAVRFRGFRAVKAFTTLVNPDTGEPLPPIITKITGIRDSDLIYEPTIGEIFQEFIAFLGDDAVVGHNIKSFDIKFLQQSGFDIEIPQRAYYDTLGMAKKLIPSEEIQNYKLETLLERFGIVRSSSHRGESDSIASGILFAVLLSMAGEQGKLDKIT